MEQEAELSLLQSMLQLQKLVFSCVDRKEFPFTRTQFLIFTVLALEGDLNMKQIAQYISSSQEQATRAVAPLADMGYVERYTNPRNRTHVYVRLTESGRQFLDEQRGKMMDKLSGRLMTSLSEEEIKTLYAVSSSMNKLLLTVK